MTVSPQPGNQDERRCVCGDTLGQHDVDGDRQCLAGDPDNPWECDCSEFRAAAAAGETGAGEEADDPWSEARESVLCACGSPGSRHAGVRGLPLDGCLDSPCPCTKFEPAPSAGQDTDCAGCRHPKGLHVWEYEDCCSGPGPTKYGCGCPAFTTTPPPTLDEIRASLRPAPSAGQDTGQMRDEPEWVSAFFEWAKTDKSPGSYSAAFAAGWSAAQGPLRQLIAERDDLRRELDQARGQVQRVRDEAAQERYKAHDAMNELRDHCSRMVLERDEWMRRALDGET